MTRITFGEFKPDQPAHLNDGLVTCDGVYPIASGYAPIGSFAAFQNGTLAARCIGAGGYRYTGSAYLFAATTTNIYTYSSAGYASVASALSGTQTVGVRFCPFGGFMLATNGVDPIKKFDPAAPSAMTTLGGTPPTARFLAVVRGFVVAGYAGGSPLAVAWSDTGNPASWTPGGSSQAGQYNMPTGGDVTGVVGGEYGLIFQERRIVRMSYTADASIWQWDEIATDCGCIAPKSLATFGKVSFFWSNKGFMACDGTTVQSIGDEKVDRTFQNLASSSYFDYMSAVVDPRHSLYLVAAPSANPTTTIFIYNYALQRWSTATIANELLFSALSLSTSIDDLDAIYGNLDAMPLSLDSASFRGGYPLLLMFNGSHGLGALAGPNLAASFVDGKKELVSGHRARIRAARPLTDALAPTVTISGQNSLSDAAVGTAYTVRSTNGVFKTREAWNLSQVKLDIPAGAQWTFAQGYDVEAIQGRAI
jgi:hypothetical protein